MAQESLKKNLAEAVASKNLAIIVGTGVTAAATGNQKVDGFSICGWTGLLKHGVWTLRHTHGLVDEQKAKIFDDMIDSGDVDLMIAAGEQVTTRLSKKAPAVYHCWLKDSVGRLNPSKPDIVKVLAKLGGVLATLNYDSILETVLKRQHVSWRNRDGVEKVLRGHSNAVLHLHGYFDEPDSLVLGLREYQRVATDLHSQAVLQLFTLDRTLLFVGCGGTFEDPNFSRLIDWAKPALENSTHRHFVLCRDADVDGLRQRAPQWLVPLGYGTSYEDLIPFLKSLIPPKATRRSSSRPTSTSVGIDRGQYATEMKKRYRAPKLEALDQTGVYYRELDLWRVFVWQNVRECQEYLPQVLELPKEHIRRLREAGQLDADGEPEQQSHEIESLRRRYVEQPVHNARDILDNSDVSRFVLLGDPGSGKSSLMQTLIRRWVDEFEQGKGLNSIPFLVELGAFAKAKGERIQNVLDFFADCDQAVWKVSREDLQFLLSSGQASLFLDGLDEIFDVELRREVAQGIVHLSQNYPLAKIIVTSRVIGYQGEALRGADFRHFMLQDLDDEQIATFIEGWHRDTYRPEEANVRKEKHDRLVTALQDSRAIRELAGNPMLLTMMAIVNRSQELPRDRAELYRQCSKLLLDRWKIEEALSADPTLREDRSAFDPKEKQNLLRQIARFMQEGTQGLAGNIIARDALENVIDGAIQSLVKPPALRVAKALVKHLRDRVYILCFLGADSFGFVHRTFLEFFCADELRERFEKTKAMTEEELSALFVGHATDETWREVLALLAGMLATGVVGRIVERLLAIREPAQARPAVFLAASCLAEVRRKSDLVDVVSSTEARLLELTEWDHPYYYRSWGSEVEEVRDTRMRAVRALVGISVARSERKAWLKDRARNDDNSDVRHACVQELARGWKSDPDTLPWLKDRARNDDNSDVRHACVQELARGWKSDPDTLPWLKDRARNDDKWAVRPACVQELARGWKSDPNTLPWLKDRARNDDNIAVRQACVQELARGWKSDPDTLPLLKDRARNDDDSDVRHACVQELARGWKGDPDTLPWLKDRARNDDNSAVRHACVRELAQGWKSDPDTLPWLKDRARNDDNRFVRPACVQELARGWKSDPDTLPLLKDRARNDDNWVVRQACVRELARGWKSDPDTLPLLKNRARNDDNWAVRQACVQELAQGWKADLDTLPLLKDRARNDDSSAVRQACVLELARGWKSDPDTLPWLKDRARNDSAEDVRQACVQELARGWKSDPDTLLLLKDRARNDSDKDVRQACVQELARGWKSDPDTLPLLKNRARNDDNSAVHHACVQELARGWKSDPDTLPLLKNRARNDDNSAVRQACVQELARGWKSDPDTLLLLKDRARNDSDKDVRHACVQELAREWKSDPDTLPLLKDRARNDSAEDVRKACVQELARGWKSDPDTLPWLKDCARNDSTEDVRKACVQGLARGWKSDPDTLPWLKDRARNDDNSAVRHACVRELAQGWKSDPDTLPLLKDRARNDDNSAVRKACMQELARGWNSDPDTLPLLKNRARNDDNSAVRKACVQELARGWKSDPDTLPWLKDRARNDSAEDVRKACVQELARGWNSDPDTLPWLKDRARNDSAEDVRKACVQELARGWNSDPDTLPWLKDRARNDDDSDVRHACVQELARGWKGDPDTLPWLKDRARNDDNIAVRQACVLELARGWKSDPDTLPWLKDRARNDDNTAVRQACVLELARVWKSDPDTLPWLKDRARNDSDVIVRHICVWLLKTRWEISVTDGTEPSSE